MPRQVRLGICIVKLRQPFYLTVRSARAFRGRTRIIQQHITVDRRRMDTATTLRNNSHVTVHRLSIHVAAIVLCKHVAVVRFDEHTSIVTAGFDLAIMRNEMKLSSRSGNHLTNDVSVL